MSVFPNVAGQTTWIAGRPASERVACTPGLHAFTASHGEAFRASFHTATAYWFVAAAYT